MASDRFGLQKYVVRRKFFQFLGAAFHIYDENESQVLFYSKLKAFKLKEDIRVYSGEDMQQEVLTIKARKMLDISSAYDVVDPTTGQKVGAMRRKGMKSIIKDEWVILDVSDNEIGLVEEDSMALALVRRFVPYANIFLPQAYHGSIGGTQVCQFKQNFNPFVLKVSLDYGPDRQGLLDRRLGIAAAILLCAIEGRQS